jgi:DNA-binding NtrC family response regulator
MAINVFVLDDEVDLCEIFDEFFSSEDVHIRTFTNPDEAIAACHKTTPDIFFIDYRLPNTTGDKVALAVDKNIPKILLTGDLSVNAEYKFDKIMSKPYQFSDIQLELDKYL